MSRLLSEASFRAPGQTSGGCGEARTIRLGACGESRAAYPGRNIRGRTWTFAANF